MKIKNIINSSFTYLGLLAGFGQFLVWYLACTLILTLFPSNTPLKFASLISFIITFAGGQESLGKSREFNIAFYIGTIFSILLALTVLLLR